MSLYKLVAKVLAGWLTLVMDKIILSNHLTFIKDSQLVDGGDNEIKDVDKKIMKYCLNCTIGFEKVYGSLSWSFLDYMMRIMGFEDEVEIFVLKSPTSDKI